MHSRTLGKRILADELKEDGRLGYAERLFLIHFLHVVEATYPRHGIPKTKDHGRGECGESERAHNASGSPGQVSNPSAEVKNSVRREREKKQKTNSEQS